MPADATIQNALIVIAVAVSVQTVLMLCTVIAISVAWKRAHLMLDTQLNRFSERLDDMATQTRMAVDAIDLMPRERTVGDAGIGAGVLARLAGIEPMAAPGRALIGGGGRRQQQHGEPERSGNAGADRHGTDS